MTMIMMMKATAMTFLALGAVGPVLVATIDSGADGTTTFERYTSGAESEAPPPARDREEAERAAELEMQAALRAVDEARAATHQSDDERARLMMLLEREAQAARDEGNRSAEALAALERELAQKARAQDDDRDDEDVARLHRHLDELAAMASQLRAQIEDAKAKGEARRAEDLHHQYASVVERLDQAKEMASTVARGRHAMQEHAHTRALAQELEAALHEAEKSGDRGRAEELRARLVETRALSEHQRTQARDHEAHLRDEDLAAAMRAQEFQIHETESRLHEMRARLEHMHNALAQLKEAQMHDAAQHVERQMIEQKRALERMVQDTERAREHHADTQARMLREREQQHQQQERRPAEAGAAAGDGAHRHPDLHEAVEALRREVRELREVVNHLHQRLDQISSEREAAPQ